MWGVTVSIFTGVVGSFLTGPGATIGTPISICKSNPMFNISVAQMLWVHIATSEGWWELIIFLLSRGAK